MCGLESPADAKYILAMSPHMKSLLANIGAIGIIVGALILLFHPQWVGFDSSSNEQLTIPEPIGTTTPPIQAAPVDSAVPTSTPNKAVAKPPLKSAPITQVVPTAPAPSIPDASDATTSDNFSVTRIPNPYQFPPQKFDVINERARPTLVNILCGARSGTFRPISASGVIIDPRGVILTNAHVAQYFLLAS